MANVVEIVLKAVDKTKEGFTTPIRNLNDLITVADKVGPALLGVATTAATALAIMGRQSINTADDMGKLAQKAGTTAEEFSAWSYAAKLNEIENEKLAKSFKEVSKNIVEAQTVGSPAAKLFDQLGISTKTATGEMRTAGDVILEIADRFADSADGVGKTTVATKLFGDKLGQDLIPFLNQGAAGIRELMSEASELGQTFSTKSATSADEFNDNLDKLKLISQGVVNVFVSGLLPTLADLTTEFIAASKEGGQLNFVMTGVADTSKMVKWLIEGSVEAFRAFIDNIVAGAMVVEAFAKTAVDGFRLAGNSVAWFGMVALEMAKGNFGNAIEFFRTGFGQLVKDSDKFKDVAKGSIDAMINAVQTAARGNQNTFEALFGIKDIKAAAAQFGANFAKELTESLFGSNQPKKQLNLIDEEQSSKMAVNAISQLRKIGDMRATLVAESLRGSSAEIAAEDQKYQKQLEQIDALGADEDTFYQFREQAFSNHQQRLLDIQASFMEERRRLESEMNASIAGGTAALRIQEDERYRERLQQIAALNLTEEEALRLSIKASQEYSARRREIFNQELRAVSGAFGQMADAAKAFGKKGFAAYKAFAIAQAIIDTYTGATAAYKSLAGIPFVGPALGAAAAAAAIASGIARVNTIRSQEPGIAHAGLTSVPEEATYILQKGERVIAPRQNDDLTEFIRAGGSGQARVTLMIDGRVIGEVLGDLSRDGRLQIDERAVVVA